MKSINRFAIHYDKKGTHIVPVERKKDMELWKYSGKNVRIYLKSGNTLSGKAYDYIPEWDNPSGVASISIDIYEIYENEIKSIEEII